MEDSRKTLNSCNSDHFFLICVGILCNHLTNGRDIFDVKSEGLQLDIQGEEVTVDLVSGVNGFKKLQKLCLVGSDELWVMLQNSVNDPGGVLKNFAVALVV